MKKFFFLALLALVGGTLLAIQLVRDPGYILIAYGNQTFETSLFALLVAVLLVVAIIKLVASLLGAMIPRSGRSSAKIKAGSNKAARNEADRNEADRTKADRNEVGKTEPSKRHS